MNFTNDPVVINYINMLREIMKKKKPQITIIENKPTMIFPNDPVENQIRADFNNYIKKTYPEMAYVNSTRVKVKHIPDNCGLENKGIILKVLNGNALVELDNGKQAEYAVSNLELL